MGQVVTIYTDGSCHPNPNGFGGWGAVLVCGGAERGMGGDAYPTTNNRMEVAPAVKALEMLNSPCDVTLVSDSSYLIRGINEWLPRWVAGGMDRYEVDYLPNKDLWEALLAQARRHTIKGEHVRGHTGHPMNERCHQMADAMRINLTKTHPEGRWVRLSDRRKGGAKGSGGGPTNTVTQYINSKEVHGG